MSINPNHSFRCYIRVTVELKWAPTCLAPNLYLFIIVMLCYYVSIIFVMLLDIWVAWAHLIPQTMSAVAQAGHRTKIRRLYRAIRVEGRKWPHRANRVSRSLFTIIPQVAHTRFRASMFEKDEARARAFASEGALELFAIQRLRNNEYWTKVPTLHPNPFKTWHRLATCVVPYAKDTTAKDDSWKLRHERVVGRGTCPTLVPSVILTVGYYL